MSLQIGHFFAELIKDEPLNIYGWLLVCFCIGAFLVLVFRGVKRGWKAVCLLLLGEYLLFIYCSTVIFRPFQEEIGSNFIPFWSYFAYDKVERPDLLPENILNIVVFIPVGLLLGCTFHNMRWWNALLAGCFVSASIESMQFFLKRGFAEFDDVMHNVLGCMIGYGVFSLVKKGYEKHSKRRVAVL